MNKVILKYTTDVSGILPRRKRDTDLGIDLPSKETILVSGGGVTIVDTGVTFEFPEYGKVRRWLTKLLFGIEFAGVGGVIRGRGGPNYDILAGVIDVGYRGSVKIKIHNTSECDIILHKGDYIAQMILTPSLSIDMVQVGEIDTDTSRGVSGGINK